MVTVSHYLSLTRGSKKVKLKTIIQFSLAIQSPVMMKSNVWLSTSTESVGSVSQKWFSIVWFGPGRCHQTGDTCPCHPSSQNIVLMWHNINIRDPSLTQLCDPTNKSSATFPFIRFVSSSDWPSALSLYTFISGPKEVSGETRGDERIFIWLDKYTRRLISCDGLLLSDFCINIL